MNPDLNAFLQAWTGGADVSDAERERVLYRFENDAAFRAECAEEIRLLGLIKAVQTPTPRWLDLHDALGLPVATPAETTADDLASRVLHLVQNEPRKPANVRWFAWRPLTAAAAVVVLVALVWLAWPRARETGLMLASADAAVKVERAGTAIMLPVGTMLREGDLIITGGAGIVASYPVEETRLELDPHTRLEVLTHRDGKRLRLLAGSLSAEVSPQPEGRPMRLFSSGSEAVVLGTRFTLNADPANRELAVQKGAVRVNRAATADSIVVSAAEKVMLGAKSLELEPLPPLVPPRWRDEHTLAFDFESPVNWPVLRCGRVVAEPLGNGRCLTAELVEVVRRQGDKLVLAASLRPQCVLSDASTLKLRYWAASGIESIEVFLYVFGVERAFKVEVKPEAHDRWAEWSVAFNELKSAAGSPPESDATVRSLSIHTSPVSGPLAFYVDDVVLEHVSPLPLSR